MGLPAENKPIIASTLIQKFQSAIGSLKPVTATVYAKAVMSLKSFLESNGYEAVSLSNQILTDWIVGMNLKGVAFSTARSYINAISGLSKRIGFDEIGTDAETFTILRNRLRDFKRELWETRISKEDSDKFIGYCRSAKILKGDNSLAVDILLCSLLTGLKSVAEIALMTRSDMIASSDETKAISERQSGERRKFVFNLRQSYLTPRQLARETDRVVSDFFRWSGISFFGTADATLRSYWAFAALCNGMPPSVVVSVLGSVPAGIPVLSLCQRDFMVDDERHAIISEIASTFIYDPPQWYAMRLRQKVKYQEPIGRLKSEVNDFMPELFYPFDEIASRSGSGVKFRLQPVISDVVFFRCRQSEVAPLFSRIGDLAWCYTVPDTTRNRYAVIPKRSFEEFQQTIGRFTSDFEVAPIGELTPHVNDRVMILGSAFKGINARITDIITSEEGKGVIFRLHFVGDNGIDFRVKMDSRMVRKCRAI